MSSGIKKFVDFTSLSAFDINEYLMNQTVMVFASSAARTSAFSTAGVTVTEGMVTYLLDTNLTQYYDGSTWISYATATTPAIGSVVKVVHNIYSTSYSRSNTSGTPIDVTGWNMSITPSKAGNKIIILAQCALYSICDGYLHLKKNGSLLASPLISVPRIDFIYDDASFFAQYVDTAASTSAITYQFAATATGCSGFFGVNSQGGISSTIMIEVQS